MTRIVLIFITLISLCCHGQHKPKNNLKELIDLSELKIQQGELENAWALALTGAERSKTLLHHDSLIQFLKLQGKIQGKMGNEKAALKINLDVLELLKQRATNSHDEAEIYLQIGKNYRILNDYKPATAYLKKALITAKKCSNCSKLEGRVVIAIGSLYLHKGDEDSAKIWLINMANELPPSVQEQESFRANHSYWLSRYFEQTKDYDKAIAWLKITTAIDSKNENLEFFHDDQFQLAELLFKKGNRPNAMVLYQECLNFGERNGILRMNLSCLKRLFQISLEDRDSIQAFNYLLKYNQVNDSMYTMNELSEVRKLEFNHQLKLMDVQKEYEIKVAKEKEDKSKLLTWISIVSGCFIITILIVLGVSISKRHKRSLMVKKKELALYTAKISSRNEAITAAIASLKEEIEKVGNNAELKSTLNQLKLELKNEDFWKDFDIRFRDVQANFYSALAVAHPNLSKSEVRLCSFLKLKMTTKEIASLTKKTVNSVNVAIHRLKKKMDVPDSKTLYTYINSEKFEAP